MNVYLIGYRCTGKTTLGKALSKKLDWNFIDSDEQIIKASGMTINEVVAKEGWCKFRKIERQVIERIGEMEKCIVATGGGVVLDPNNISIMQSSGKLVWLKARPETIKARFLNDCNTEDFRPALTAKGLYAEIVETLNEREPLYRKAMDLEFDTDGNEIDRLCKYVLSALELSDLS